MNECLGDLSPVNNSDSEFEHSLVALTDAYLSIFKTAILTVHLMK